MPGDGGGFPLCAIHEHRMTATLAQQDTAVMLQMAEQFAALHRSGMRRGSLITFWPLSDSSASVRFASSTSATASLRLCLAASNVAACVFAPGNSSTKPMYPSGTLRKTAVNSMANLILSLSRRRYSPTYQTLATRA